MTLDVILNGSPDSPAYLCVGGSCGNVLSALAYLGWDVAPVARLANNRASKELLKDLTMWNVNQKFISNKPDGSTPIIIHRILKDKGGNPKHRFEFRDPDLGKWLPQYKPVLASYVEGMELQANTPQVFYFDRASRGTIDLAKKCKKNNALVFFEPTSIADLRLFSEAVATSDIVKFSADRISNYDKVFGTQQCPLEIRTLGSEGLEYRFSHDKQASKWEHLKPFTLDQNLIKDTAGAGDWCSVGILHTLGSGGFNKFKKRDIKKALIAGQAYASLSICFNGSRGIMYQLRRKQFIRFSNQIMTSKFAKREKLPLSTESHLKPHKGLKVSTLYLK